MNNRADESVQEMGDWSKHHTIKAKGIDKTVGPIWKLEHLVKQQQQPAHVVPLPVSDKDQKPCWWQVWENNFTLSLSGNRLRLRGSRLYLGIIGSILTCVSQIKPISNTDTGSSGVSIKQEKYYAVDYMTGTTLVSSGVGKWKYPGFSFKHKSLPTNMQK